MTRHTGIRIWLSLTSSVQNDGGRWDTRRARHLQYLFRFQYLSFKLTSACIETCSRGGAFQCSQTDLDDSVTYHQHLRRPLDRRSSVWLQSSHMRSVCVGCALGPAVVGTRVGCAEGVTVGQVEGLKLGLAVEGEIDGCALGLDVVGTSVG